MDLSFQDALFYFIGFQYKQAIAKKTFLPHPIFSSIGFIDSRSERSRAKSREAIALISGSRKSTGLPASCKTPSQGHNMLHSINWFTSPSKHKCMVPLWTLESINYVMRERERGRERGTTHQKGSWNGQALASAEYVLSQGRRSTSDFRSGPTSWIRESGTNFPLLKLAACV